MYSRRVSIIHGSGFPARSFPSGSPAYGSPTAVYKSVVCLLFAATTIMLTISGNLLGLMGIPYLSPGGSILTKIHPYMYALTSAVFLLLPAFFFKPYLSLRHPASMFLMVLSLILLVEFAQSSGVSYIVDTLIAGPMAGLIVVSLPSHVQRLCLKLIVTLVALNSSLALFEALSRVHALPFYAFNDDRIFNFDEPFRATALLGHPLENALITSPVAIVTFALFRSLAVKYGLTTLFIASLFAFGARFATGITIALVAFLLLSKVRRFLQGSGRVTLGALAANLALIVLVPLLLTTVFLSTSLGERIWARLFVDDSISARVNLFEIFSVVGYHKILFGIDNSQILKLTRLGVVENYWVLTLLQFGILLFIPFLAALLTYFVWLWRNTGVAGKYALFAFILVSSSNNSLATQTPALAIATILVLCASACEISARAPTGTPRFRAGSSSAALRQKQG